MPKCNMNCFHCIYVDCINDSISDVERHKRYAETHKQELKQYKQKLYYSRKANGICTRCGKRPIAKGSTTRCVDCLIEGRRKISEKRRERGIPARVTFDGITFCTLCGKNPPVKGYKMCECCLPLSQDRAKHARTFIDRDAARKRHEELWNYIKRM